MRRADPKLALDGLREGAALARRLRAPAGMPESLLARLREGDARIGARADRLVVAGHGLPSPAAVPEALRALLAEPCEVLDRACLALGAALAIRALGPMFLAADLEVIAAQAGREVVADALPLAGLVNDDAPSPAIPPDLLPAGRALLAGWARQRFGESSGWLAARWPAGLPDLGAASDEAIAAALAAARPTSTETAPRARRSERSRP